MEGRPDMGLFTTRTPTNLPVAPKDYDQSFMNRLINTLTQYFQQQDAVQQINVSKLNFDINRLPTDASLASLRSGDVYRDTTAANVLKVKP